MGSYIPTRLGQEGGSILFILFVMSLLSVRAAVGPAYPSPVRIMTENGKEVEITMRGDETVSVGRVTSAVSQPSCGNTKEYVYSVTGVFLGEKARLIYLRGFMWFGRVEVPVFRNSPHSTNLTPTSTPPERMDSSCL